MKNFELPKPETIRAVTTLNAWQFHEVLFGSFRVDDQMRVEWRDKNQPTDLYVTTMDRIAYVVAKGTGTGRTFIGTISHLINSELNQEGGLVLSHLNRTATSRIWVEGCEISAFRIGQRVRVTVEGLE